MGLSSHQVMASPFKPLTWADKMDLFGYTYIPNYAPTREKYLVAELKRDTARDDDIDQLMKYVDWVREEYAFGDYSMIKAFLVAHAITNDVINRAKAVGIRHFLQRRRPSTAATWSDLTLVTYKYNGQKLVFQIRWQG